MFFAVPAEKNGKVLNSKVFFWHKQIIVFIKIFKYTLKSEIYLDS